MENSWIKQASLSVWKEVLKKVKHGVIFMDQQCAECLHWLGGPSLLFEAGALDIKDFSSFECGLDTQKKAIFIVSSMLQGKTVTVIQDIVSASKFDYSVVFTTVSSECHKIAFGMNNNQSGSIIFEQFEEKICEWMGNMNYTAEVLFSPLFSLCYSSFLFLIPSLHKFFPLQNQDLPAIDSMRKSKGEKNPIQRLLDVHFFSLPVSYQTQIKQLVVYLDELLETLSCKEEIFALGNTSRLIATQLANLPSGRQRRKTAITTASLVLVDRTLDPVGICHHSESSLMDKIYGLLPELSGHCDNVSIDMLKLTSAKTLISNKIDQDEISAIRDVVSCSGCLCPADDACPKLLQDMICLSQAKSFSLIKKSLEEACIEEGIEVSSKTKKNRAIHEEINELIEKFYGNTGAILYHANLLQLSSAVSQTLSDVHYKQWMKISAMEKLLLLDENPIAKIVDLTNQLDENEKKQWTVEEIFGFLIFVCSLQDLSETNDDDSWDELSSSLSLSISDSPPEELPNGLCEILGIQDGDDNDADLDVVQDAVEQLLNKLKGLSSPRLHLSHYKDLLKSSLGPPEYKPLVTQLMEKILDPSRPDLQPDLELISTGLMDLLKSGFSMFKKVSQPRPNDSKVLFLFVVGGISFEEVASVKKMVEEYNASTQSSIQVVVGSTCISTADTALDRFLFSNNLSPDL